MTRYSIGQDTDGLTIRLTDTGNERDRLLAEFQDCRQGRCDCPTDEYQKVSSLSIESDDGDSVTMRLTPKPGERLDEAEIDTCLQHTVAKFQR